MELGDKNDHARKEGNKVPQEKKAQLKRTIYWHRDTHRCILDTSEVPNDKLNSSDKGRHVTIQKDNGDGTFSINVPRPLGGGSDGVFNVPRDYLKFN